LLPSPIDHEVIRLVMMKRIIHALIFLAVMVVSASPQQPKVERKAA